MVVDPAIEVDSIHGIVRAVRVRRGGNKTWTAEPDSAVTRAYLSAHVGSSVTSLRLCITIPCTRPGGVVE